MIRPVFGIFHIFLEGSKGDKGSGGSISELKNEGLLCLLVRL